MKRLFTSLALCTMSITLFCSCDTLFPNEEPNNNQNSDKAEQHTPDEHKAKLEEIAIEFINYFNPDDTEDITRVLFALSEYIEYADFDEYAKAMVTSAAIGVKKLSVGSFMEFTTRATEDFVYDINDPEFNNYSGYIYEYSNQEWKRSTIDDAKKIILKWDDAVAEITWVGGQLYEFQDPIEDVNYDVYVPTNITYTLDINGQKHLIIAVNPTITDNYTISTSTLVDLNGGYILNVRASGNNKGFEFEATIDKNNVRLVTSEMLVGINNFTDPNNWIGEYINDYMNITTGESWQEIYYDYSVIENFANGVLNGALRIQILDLVVIGAGDFEGMYYEIDEKLDEQYDYYDPETWKINLDINKKYCEEVCKYVNDKVNCAILYNDSKELIANIYLQTYFREAYEVVMEDGSIECGEDMYKIEPVLCFPDNSKYSLDSYFTEQAFGGFIESVKSLMERFYEQIPDDFFDENEEE